MKPNFALSLSFDGLRLMHRVEGGWHLVGDVALDNPDMTAALARLKAAGEALQSGEMSTKLLIPNDQIKYLALDTTRAEEDDVRAALDGATPYAVDDLVYDFAKGGGRTYVAAVARETLDEAQQFAEEHGFNPVSFAAVPEPFTYVGEAHFGAVSGQSVARDDEAVVIIGEAAVSLPPEAVFEDASEAMPPLEPEVETPDLPEVPDETPDEAPAEDAPKTVEPVPVEPEQDPVPEVIEPEQPEEAVPESDAPEDESAAESGATSESDAFRAPEPEAPSDPEAAPLFASRLRADRNEGRPAPQAEDATPAAAAKPDRTEPSFSRRTPPSLAVPTGRGTDPMPPLSAPSRDEDAPAPAPSLTIETPAPETVPAITGEAASALSPVAAVAAASLAVEPDPVEEPERTPEARRSAAATAMGAASAVGGAVGGMFASRRMARAKAKEEAATAAPEADKPDEKSRLTVFGARKKPAAKPKPVVGGKPRFLGLILTAILLVFLLAIAAFAALSDEGFARWFGFGASETQIAETPSADSDPAASEVAAASPENDAAPADAPDALANPTAPTGGQVLTPEEAQRIYAATGVWQRAPRIPLIPRTTTLDDLQVASAPNPVMRVPPSPLATASSVAGDAVIATPIDPPPPSATFDFDERGLVVATPDGAVTPDGILIIAGRPPLNPPTRPGTVAPEVTPQDQLATVVPEAATPIEDAPEGVIAIAGRPAIEPPLRPGTAAPAPAPEAEALAAGEAPIVADDGLLVLAGAPPVLPPVRPGTVAPDVQTEEAAAAVETPATAVEAEGLNLISGPPPILPPARPGTLAPQDDASVESLTQDVASALTSGTAQTPTADTPRPLPRPAEIVQAAAARANAPILGDLTATQAAAFRPRTRPAGLAPEPTPEPETEPDPVVEQAAAPTGLQIAPEIAAAVQAAANRPNPIVNPTAQAVAASVRPDPRPRNMQRIVQRAAAAQERAAAQVAAVAPRTVAPSGPTAGSVATNATLENAINLREVNLIGIYGGSNDRRALVRLANGRYTRVTVGDSLDGGRVTAISAGALSYTKRGRSITLEVPG